MRAVAYKTPQPISAETSLIDVELPMPRLGATICSSKSKRFRSIPST